MYVIHNDCDEYWCGSLYRPHKDVWLPRIEFANVFKSYSSALLVAKFLEECFCCNCDIVEFNGS